MSVKFNGKDGVAVEVIGEFGVHYEGTDYWPGDTFTCTQSWAVNLIESGRVQEVIAPREEKKAPPSTSQKTS